MQHFRLLDQSSFFSARRPLLLTPLDVLNICQNLFHACPLEAGLTLMMGGRTVEGGNRARRMAGGSARGPRARANTPGPGATDSKFSECTRGPVGTATKELGRRARGMALVWRAKGGGNIGGNGRKGSKAGMASWKAPAAVLVTKAPGATGCRMDTAQRPTRMEVSMKFVSPKTYMHVAK